MKKVLVISPRFPPVNAADHQRVRMALPYFREYGWKPTVLCVDARFVEAPQDPYLLQTIPEEISVESVPATSQALTRKIGFGGLSWRAKQPLNRRGQQLLTNKKFDLIYFSTTEFGVLPLATQWKKKFRVPYVLDIQDPWVNDYYRNHQQRPPGGKLKHRLTQTIASWQEPATLRHAAAITTVSPHYETDLVAKYPFLDSVPFHVIPFGGPEHDFESLKKFDLQISSDKPTDTQEWLYIGRAGCDMQFSLRAFFCSVKKALAAGLVQSNSLRIQLFGTDYAAAGAGKNWSQQAADEFGLATLVKETPDRIPYFETLQRLTRADALFVPGSDDPGYTASKIYPYILAKRPLLTLFHKQSSVNEVINNTKSGTAITFDNRSTIESVAEETYQRWFLPKAYSRVPQTDWQQFAPYTACAMTSQLVNVFDRVLSNRTFRIAS
jgi:hypothetical protein